MRVPVLPWGISLLFFPAMAKSCGSFPLLTSLKVTLPCGIFALDSVNLNSFIVTVTVVAAAADGRAAMGAAATRAASATPSASVMRFMMLLPGRRFRGHGSRDTVKRRLVLGVEELGFERLALDVVAVALLAPLLERHRQLEDARAVDLEHVEAHAVVVDRVTCLRLATEQTEDKAGHGVVVLVRHLGLEPLVEVVDRVRPVDDHGVLVDLFHGLVR